jgi:hypothetical protein
MRTFIIIAGILIITLSSVYFFKLAYLLYNSYEFTDFAYGILAGRIIVLAAGILLLYFGIKMKKR